MSAYDPFFDESDLQEERYYCKHGTFIGNPYGGDYLCGWCEDGTPWVDFLAYWEAQRQRAFWAGFRQRVLDEVLWPNSKKVPNFLADLIVSIWIDSATSEIARLAK